jgi:hypothetical protein
MMGFFKAGSADFLSWNVQFWWYEGPDRWSHFLDWSRSICDCLLGRLREQNLTCYGPGFFVIAGSGMEACCLSSAGLWPSVLKI